MFFISKKPFCLFDNEQDRECEVLKNKNGRIRNLGFKIIDERIAK